MLVVSNKPHVWYKTFQIDLVTLKTLLNALPSPNLFARLPLFPMRKMKNVLSLIET